MPTFKKGDAVIITSDRHLPRHNYHKGQICTVVSGPDSDGDYRLQSESGRENFVSVLAFEAYEPE